MPLKSPVAGLYLILAYIYKGCAEFLSEPLCNMCITNSVFSEILKYMVCLIFKSGDKTNISNCRPIPTFLISSKIFENIIYEQIKWRII